jgi:hypothetical protein
MVSWSLVAALQAFLSGGKSDAARYYNLNANVHPEFALILDVRAA